MIIRLVGRVGGGLNVRDGRNARARSTISRLIPVVLSLFRIIAIVNRLTESVVLRSHWLDERLCSSVYSTLNNKLLCSLVWNWGRFCINYTVDIMMLKMVVPL